MSLITLHEGDNRETLRRLIDQGVRVHSVVTDPPYGLTSVTKRFGADKAAPAKFGTDGAFARASAGFMGSKWDGTGIERDPEFWALVWEILLPGGYVAAFSSSRTGHWQACAMEMAGFIMHPMLGWVFGSGFPKAHNASKAIDKELGTAESSGGPKSAAHAGWIERGRMRGAKGEAENNEGWQRPWMDDEEAVSNAARVYVPGSPEAAQWEGWAYGAQALKPAIEPIYVGQKPFSEKNGALNLLKHGVGAINIDGCRVATGGETVTNHGSGSESAISKGIYGDSAAQETHQTAGQALGRHPANLLHDGSAEVVALFPGASISTKPGTKTERVYGKFNREGEASADRRYTEAGSTNFAAKPGVRRDAETSAARFFNAFPDEDGTWQPDFSKPIFYHPKASKSDRAGSKHPTVKPIKLMEWLVTLITPPGGTTLDPFAGSGTTGQAARNLGFDCILMEAEAQFASDIRRRLTLPAPAANDCAAFDDILGGAATPDYAELLG